jgi:SAM-dependent MidA family methyltransferase
MTPAARLLHDEIAELGPTSFHRFMDVALYHPEHGYYRSRHDPFGRHGDYYTAEQLQPVFGILIASYVRSVFEEFGRPHDYSIVELGPGRREMAEFFSGFHYVPVDFGDALPERFTGVVLANEFFDALPVHVAKKREGRFHELLVDSDGAGFRWLEGPPVSGEIEAHLRKFAAAAEEGAIVEANLAGLQWIVEVSRRLERGHLVAIDYGYTAREIVRFPSGTLMSYRGHHAFENVLSDPGTKDITAHVSFSAVEECALSHGFTDVRLSSLAGFLLGVGETDQFATALAARTEQEAVHRRLQLKSLLFGMGESFRVLLARKVGPK